MKGDIWAYNLDNNRPDQQQLAAEVAAILSTEPLALVGIEAIGNDLPKVRGYDRLGGEGNRSRQNIVIYVDENADRTDLRWIDLDTTWHRTEGPGEHEARSFPWLIADGLQVIGVHQQPQRTNTTTTGQAEGIGALSRAMGRGPEGRPALAIGDFNRRVYEPGPGPRTLATRIGGKVYGQRIDCGVGRGVKARSSYHQQVRGVRLQSDHGHAQRIEVSW